MSIVTHAPRLSLTLSLALSLAACATTSVAVPATLTGFSTPESVLHDTTRDVYLVSNIGAGGPLGADGDGTIARVWPDGRTEPRFATGLDAPKGMAVIGDRLYVSDIGSVRVIDADSGSILDTIEVDGAEFLNDIALAPDGALYVSDTAVSLGESGFTPTGHDAIYRIGPDGTVERWLEAPLGNPNGLAVSGGSLWVVTFGSGELIELSLSDGAVRARHAAPTGGLDGIEVLGDGRLLVTSWAGSALYLASTAGEFALEREGVESPADVGYDRGRGRLLLPLMNAGSVLIDAVRAP